MNRHTRPEFDKAQRMGVRLALAAAFLVSAPAVMGGGSSPDAPAPRTVHAGPGTPFDLQGFIDQALASGQKRIVVPPGRYRVKPQRHCHLRLRDLQDVEILAKDVE